MMSIEESVKLKFTREHEEIVGNLPQCNFVHLKSHIPGLDSGQQRWEAGDEESELWQCQIRFKMLSKYI
jgi:hypothetical protein